MLEEFRPKTFIEINKKGCNYYKANIIMDMALKIVEKILSPHPKSIVVA